MGTLGNLENLNLGMGLKAHESQFIPAKHAALDGWSSLSEQDRGQKASLGVLGALLLFIIIYNLR
jgi:hypothetical protein